LAKIFNYFRALSDEEVKRFLECSDSLPHPTILNWKGLKEQFYGLEK